MKKMLVAGIFAIVTLFSSCYTIQRHQIQTKLHENVKRKADTTYSLSNDQRTFQVSADIDSILMSYGYEPKSLDKIITLKNLQKRGYIDKNLLSAYFKYCIIPLAKDFFTLQECPKFEVPIYPKRHNSSED